MVDRPVESRAVALERLQLVFEEAGTGPPVLLLHGFPGPEIWNRVLPHLSKQLRCITPHTLALGGSSSSDPADYRLDAQAEGIRRFLDRARLERVHVLGHDLGGVMAMVLASRYPHRVMKLVLSQVPPRGDWRHPFLGRISAWSRLPGGLGLFRWLMARLSFARSRRGWGDGLFAPESLAPEDLSSWNRVLSQDRASHLKLFLKAATPPVAGEILDLMRSYQRPAMLLWGCDYPLLSPSWAIQLYHEIPGAMRFELIPFSGHYPQWESPERFARAVLDFLLTKPTSQTQAGSPLAPDDEG
jgi:pimeloyl-ACP methyl ester carboxylesterase